MNWFSAIQDAHCRANRSHFEPGPPLCLRTGRKRFSGTFSGEERCVFYGGKYCTHNMGDSLKETYLEREWVTKGC